MNRRNVLTMLVAPVALGLALNTTSALAGVHPKRKRIRVRRRIRRHAFTRVVWGRPFWVVPMGLAAGWELAHLGRVVVVKETRFIEKDGRRTEVALVEDASGKREEIDITREDTAENGTNLQGSALPEGDTATPGVEGDSIE
jgi:hypothetical protein